MTTNLTNIFTSSWLLAVAITSILLVGILAPTAFSQQSTVITFDAPGAGTGPGHTTLPSIRREQSPDSTLMPAIQFMVFSAHPTAPSAQSMFLGLGQAQAKAQILSALPLEARSQDVTLTRILFHGFLRCGRRDHDV
jgi:hypothetical protein